MTDQAAPTTPTAPIFLCDNGAAYCHQHLGASAKFTGYDISGQAIYKVTSDDVREWGPIACEECGIETPTAPVAA